MFDFIAQILAIFIRPIYAVVNNYGWAIIIFTILIKIVTLPFTVKSQKSMAKMQQVQPLIAAVQRKYANNKEKQQQELMKIYEKYKISPTGGCLPLLLQMVILMGFIQIVYKPVTFILGIPKAVINEAVKAIPDLAGKTAEFAANQLNIFKYPELVEKLELGKNSLNLDFLGIDLTKVLSQNMADVMCWILPVIALALTILSTVITQRQAVKKQNPNAKNDPQAAQTQAMSKSMYVLMPIMTIWITYTWPLGCALYWVISTLTQILQQLFVQKFIVDKMPQIELKPKKKPKKIENTVEADFEDADGEFDDEEEKTEKNRVKGVRKGSSEAKFREIEEDFEGRKKSDKTNQGTKNQRKKNVGNSLTKEKIADVKDIVEKIKNDKN